MWSFYFKNIKKLMILPIILVIVSISFIGYNMITDHPIIDKDIELSGGKLLTVTTSDPVSQTELEEKFPDTNIRIASGVKKTVLIEMPIETNHTEILNNLDFNIEEHSVKEVGPALGELFWKQTQIAIAFSFLFMSFVVFVLFRTGVPSLAVIFAAFSDIIVTLTILSVTGIEMSLAVLAALLMLIGYSIDTDILLTSRLLKSKGDKKEQIKSSVKTGLTMSLTTMSALIVLYFLSTTLVLKQISMVLMIGLLIDIPITWLTNVGLLMRYLGDEIE